MVSGSCWELANSWPSDMVWAANGDGINDALSDMNDERPATPRSVIESTDRFPHATAIYAAPQTRAVALDAL